MKSIYELLLEARKKSNNIAITPVFDEKKTYKFIKKNPFLFRAFLGYKNSCSARDRKRRALKIIFSSYIMDDPALEREYKMFS